MPPVPDLQSSFRMSMPHCVAFRFLNVSLQVRTDSEELLRFFQNSYQRFRSNASSGHEFSVQMQTNDSLWRSTFHSEKQEYGVLKTVDGFVFCCKNKESGSEKLTLFRNGRQQPISRADAIRNADVSHVAEDSEHLFSFAQMALLNTLASLLPDYHLFHGAALTWNNRGFILAGAAGQGKSSLSLALVKHGCKFLSDDIACVNPTGNQLIPFPRKLNFRRRGIPILRNLMSESEINPGPVDMEKIVPGCSGDKASLRCLFLLRGITQQATINPVSQRHALLEALRLSHTPAQHPTQTIFRLAPLFNKIRCYELFAGDLDATAALICNQMKIDAD